MEATSATAMNAKPSSFDLEGRVAIITGGAGLLGMEHAAAIAEAGGLPVLWDLDFARAQDAAAAITKQWGGRCYGVAVDITNEAAIQAGFARTLEVAGRADILINNAANDPKVPTGGTLAWSRLENFPVQSWLDDISVGLTGAFLCSRLIGAHFASHGGGTILNIASDLGLIAPDQRLYRKDGLADDQQPVKPVTYSVVKHGLIGLTRYLATYWADRNVRANALCPGGVYNGQPGEFVDRLTALIPMGRMAKRDEYRGAVQFLCSPASSYVNGAVLSADGGRTAW